jgi:hypothetical protein
MQRLVVLIASGAILGALFAVACGGGNEKPPLTPDSEHAAPAMGEEAGTDESTGSGEATGTEPDAG